MDWKDRPSWLPEPRIIGIDPPEPLKKGWWRDPFSDGRVTQQRFHDGDDWTPYICYLAGRLWSEIYEVPVPSDAQPQ